MDNNTGVKVKTIPNPCQSVKDLIDKTNVVMSEVLKELDKVVATGKNG